MLLKMIHTVILFDYIKLCKNENLRTAWTQMLMNVNISNKNQ